jgi:superfamily I DNA/RNA helicase
MRPRVPRPSTHSVRTCGRVRPGLRYPSGYPIKRAEVAAVVQRVQEWIAQGVRPGEIAVCTRFNLLLDKVADGLAAVGVPAMRVKDQPRSNVEAVHLATMHAMKGLEFRCVAVVGVTDKAVPFAKEIEPLNVVPLRHSMRSRSNSLPRGGPPR